MAEVKKKKIEHVSVREGYDRWSNVYDSDGNPMVALDDAIIPALLGPVRGLRVVDLGCGTGRHTARLCRAHAKVTAVDFSEGMLSKAREKTNDPVEFIQHDLASTLPFPDQSFDRVISCLVLEHLKDLSGFFSRSSTGVPLQRVHRHLRHASCDEISRQPGAF